MTKATGKKAAKVEKAAEKPKPEGLSQEQMAQRLGCAQSTISRAIARGDVEPLSNGRLPESAVEVLRQMWAEDQKSINETADLQRRLLIAETGEKEAKAKLRQLELEREAGRYVELDVVQKDAKDTRERIVSVLRSMPQRTAKALECQCQKAAVVQAKIGDEVERAIAELAESKFAGGPV